MKEEVRRRKTYKKKDRERNMDVFSESSAISQK